MLVLAGCQGDLEGCRGGEFVVPELPIDLLLQLGPLNGSQYLVLDAVDCLCRFFFSDVNVNQQPLEAIQLF